MEFPKLAQRSHLFLLYPFEFLPLITSLYVFINHAAITGYDWQTKMAWEMCNDILRERVGDGSGATREDVLAMSARSVIEKAGHRYEVLATLLEVMKVENSFAKVDVKNMAERGYYLEANFGEFRRGLSAFAGEGIFRV